MSVFVVDVPIFMSLHLISSIEESHRELKLFNLSFYFMCLLFGLHECLSNTWVQCLQRPEEALDLLGLELQVVVSCYVGARNHTQVLCSACLFSFRNYFFV